MQTLTKMEKVVTKDCFHMTTMGENATWMKLTIFIKKLVKFLMKQNFSKS